MKKNSLGLGAVELIVAVLFFGALAIGIWATFNPLEQFWVLEDQKTKAMANEIFGSLSRYFSDRGTLPWAGEGINRRPLSSLDSEVALLIQANALRVDFTSALRETRAQKIFISSKAANAVSVCFEPSSNSLKLDPATIFTQDGQAQVDKCKTVNGAASSAHCFWCAQ